MKQKEITLPATDITGTWRGSLGGYWSTDGIIIDGTYISTSSTRRIDRR